MNFKTNEIFTVYLPRQRFVAKLLFLNYGKEAISTFFISIWWNCWYMETVWYWTVLKLLLDKSSIYLKFWMGGYFWTFFLWCIPMWYVSVCIIMTLNNPIWYEHKILIFVLVGQIFGRNNRIKTNTQQISSGLVLGPTINQCHVFILTSITKVV